MMKKRWLKTVGFIWLICICFLLLCSISASFADFYIDNIFPYMTLPLMRFSDCFSFSVGEIMIVAGVIWLVLLIIISIIYLIIFLIRNTDIKFYITFKRFAKKFYKSTVILLTIICIIMSLNCFCLYQHTPIYSDVSKEYTLEELTFLRDYVVTKCNELSLEVPRDENGEVLYEGDMEEDAKKAIENISSEYPRLSGYITTPKILYFSGFMSQQYMQGYYFPFSMEANINGIMKIMNKPFTMCHELSHTKGFIYEDEANFLGFLACIESGNTVFEYSGYLGVLNYINNDYYDAAGRSEYLEHVAISDLVKEDNMFLSDESWREVEDNSVLDTELVKEAADTFVDTSLKMSGVSDGKISYNRVVGLIITYYREIGIIE